MNCLCCGKPLRVDEGSGWHPTCVKRFFGTASLPELTLDEALLEQYAIQSANQGYTVPGVQKKLSLYLFPGRHPRLTMKDYPSGYILKPKVEEFQSLPEAEHLAMTMARHAGIATVPHALIKIGGSLAYITRRIDRGFPRAGEVRMLAMEDFCQLDLRLTQDKYRGSYERCAKIIDRHSSRPGLDKAEMFLRLAFSFLIGNSDMHLKNLSLVETAENSREYVLSPAYDLLPVSIVLPEDDEQFALPMLGKKRNIRRKDFLGFAHTCGIPESAAQKIIRRLVEQLPEMMEICAQSNLPEDMKSGLNALMRERGTVLNGRA